ncbi:MAG: hypothetical protein KDC84_09460 [Crocinitomicaceae bacterium]|nr:hypothetical protein [Crocinitomicaceae bacterium]
MNNYVNEQEKIMVGIDAFEMDVISKYIVKFDDSIIISEDIPNTEIKKILKKYKIRKIVINYKDIAELSFILYPEKFNDCLECVVLFSKRVSGIKEIEERKSRKLTQICKNVFFICDYRF